jgi:hypothetical protein
MDPALWRSCGEEWGTCMYVVINHIHLTVPVEQLRQPLEMECVPILAAQPGFAGFAFVREADDRAVVIIYWESRDAAMNGSRVFGPTWFAQHIAPLLASEQRHSTGDVLVYRSTP